MGFNLKNIWKMISGFSFMSGGLGIDLGTANTLVYVKGEGIVVREPSVVAVVKRTREPLAVGEEAKRMIGRTPGRIEAVRPLREGVIADFDCTEHMLSEFIKKGMQSRNVFRPDVVIGVPSGVTPVERRAVVKVALDAGAKRASLLEEPMAAAIGAGIPVHEPTGSMIIDIGGGTAEVAVVSLGNIVVGNSVRMAGDAMDEAIVDYVRRKYSLLIGNRMAETIKIEIGTAMDVERPLRKEIRGRDLVTGLPKLVVINSNNVREALAETLRGIVDTVKGTLEKTPPELAADIMENGIVMSGGTSLLHNLDRLISRETDIDVTLCDDPLSSVAKGTGIAVEDLEKYKSTFITSGHA